MDSLSVGTLGAMAEAAEDGVVPTLKRLGLFFAVLAAIILPAGYWTLRHADLVEHAESVARTKAAAINLLATANPDLWVYQLQRMEELLLRYPVPLNDESATVRDPAGKIVMAAGAFPDGPLLVRSSPVYDSGRIVAQVEIAHSYRPVLFGTLAAALLGLLLGAVVYATLLMLPMRALRHSTAALVREKEALRESEGRFYRLLQNVPAIAVQGYGLDGTIRYWNHASERLYGYTAREAIGRSLVELIVPPEMRTDVEQAIRQMSETGQAIPASELTLLHKDGSPVAVYSSHAIVRTPGHAPELFCLDIDLTERRKAEEALRAAEEQFRGLVEQSIAGIYIIQDGVFAYVNPRFAEIRGCGSAEELVGLDPLTLIVEKDRGAVADNMAPAARGRNAEHQLHLHRSAQGRFDLRCRRAQRPARPTAAGRRSSG